MILDLDRAAWAHVAKALSRHGKWARTNAIALPPDVLMLADIASRSASVRQATTKSTGWTSLVTTTSMTDQKLVDYHDAGTELGVSRRTVERLVADGDLPSVRIRGAARIRRADLDVYVETLTTRTEAS